MLVFSRHRHYMLTQHTDLLFTHTEHPTASIIDRDDTDNIRGKYFEHSVITINLTGRHNPSTHLSSTRPSMEDPENQWKSMKFNEIHWNSMEIIDNQIQLNSMKIYDKQSTTKWSRGQPEVSWRLAATVALNYLPAMLPALSKRYPCPFSWVYEPPLPIFRVEYFVSAYRPLNRALKKIIAMSFQKTSGKITWTELRTEMLMTNQPKSSKRLLMPNRFYVSATGKIF